MTTHFPRSGARTGTASPSPGRVPSAVTIPGVLDAAFDLTRRNSRVVAVLAVVIVLPLSVAFMVLEIRTLGLDATGDLFGGLGEEQGSPVEVWLPIAAILVGSLEVTLMAAALTPVALGTLDVVRPVGSSLGGVLRRLPAVLAGWLLVKLVEMAGLLGMVIGAAVLMVFCSLVTPILVTTTTNPFRALGESFRLVSGNFGRAVGVVSLMVVVDVSLQLSFVAVPSIVTSWTGWTLGAVAVAAIAVCSDLLSATFVGLATAVLYVDLRVRSDHLDLQRRFAALGVDW